MKNRLETTRNTPMIKVSPIIYSNDFDFQTSMSYVSTRIMSDLRYEETLKGIDRGKQHGKRN